MAYEGFDYPARTLTGLNGGTGWAGAWTGSDYPFAVNATGLVYPGLSTVGGKAVWAFSPTLNATSNRCIPLQDSGVVYLQFLSIFSSSHGGGTPNIRLSAGGLTTAAVGNNDNRPNMALLSNSLNELAVTSSPLTQLNLTIVRIDHDADVTSIWTNPDLAAFDYLNPPPAAATANRFSPEFECMELITRNSGDFDEIKVMRVASAPTSSDGEGERPPRREVLNLALSASLICSSDAISAGFGEWMKLPAADQCIVLGRDRQQLLGWATTPDFPLGIAQRQVRNGGGAYELFSGGDLNGIFIPAGGSTLVSASTTLYPIIGPA